MDQTNRRLWRAASRIHERLLQRRLKSDWQLPTQAWEDLSNLARRVERARQRGWDRAAASMLDDLSWAATNCQSLLAGLVNHVRVMPTSKPLATAGEIYRDLVALQAEFEEVACDLKSQEVWATTAPVVLERIFLAASKSGWLGAICIACLLTGSSRSSLIQRNPRRM